MSKESVYAAINIFIGLFFLYFFWLTTSSIPLSEISSELNSPNLVYTFLKLYGASLIILIIAIVNLFVGSWVLLKNPKKIFLIQILIPLLCLAWIFWSFIIFFLFSRLFIFVPILISFLIFFVVKRNSLKTAIILSLISFFVMILTFVISFEESYCWSKGQIADPTGSKMITLDKDTKLPGNIEIFKAGNLVGVNYLNHMNCHGNFHFTSSFFENLK